MQGSEHTAKQSIFLTGATGVLGARILKEILRSTDHRVFCLVRAKSASEGLERLEKILRVYDPAEELQDELKLRAVPVLGDLSHERFGLTSRAYTELADQISLMIHAGASTNLFLNSRRIDPINIGGTRNAIDFALETRHKRLCYISTFTVMGDKTFDPSFTFREDHLDVGQSFDFMSYQQSKFISEGLVRAAGQKGLQWTILRPGQIYGESGTGNYPQGEVQVTGLFYDIFRTVIETQTALLSTTHYDLTPVDYVGRAVLHAALTEKAIGQTFHLTNPDIKSYTEVIQVIERLGYPINHVPHDDYRMMIDDRGLQLSDGSFYSSPTTKGFRWWFKRAGFDFSKGAITECAATQQFLAGTGIECPKIDAQLIGAYIENGIRKDYFAAPPVKRAKLRSELRPNEAIAVASI